MAVGNGQHLDAVLRLGATTAADHRSTPLQALGTFDVVLDTAGAQLTTANRLLAPGGRMVTSAYGTLPAAAAVLRSSTRGGRRIRTFTVRFATRHLAALSDMVDEGVVSPVVQRSYELADVAEAHTALAASGTFGKHLVRVSPHVDPFT